MKPPLLANYRGYAALLLMATLLSLGCERPKQQSTPPEKQTEPATTATDMVEVNDGATKETAAKKSPAEAETGQSKTDETVSELPAPSGEGPALELPKISETKPERPATEPKNEEPVAPAAELLPSEPRPATPEELGPPLGENLKKLVQLQPNPVLWIDQKGHRVVMLGQVCQRNALLEMFACTRNKEHESVVVIPTEAEFIHAALLAVGAKAGRPVQFHPKYVPATGTEIEVLVRWKDEKGKTRSVKAQDWVRNMNTKKAMKHNWVFAGSSYWTNEKTGKKHYQANSGDLICVSNFPSAMLDLPVESSQRESELLYEAFTENIPPLGTPVTVILKPKLNKPNKPEPAKRDAANR